MLQLCFTQTLGMSSRMMGKDGQRLGAFGVGVVVTIFLFSLYREDSAPKKYAIQITSGLSPQKRWVTDTWGRGILFSTAVSKVVHTKQSDFQLVQVFDSPDLGRVLMLDEFLQTSVADEAGYHEMIAHVPMSFKRSKPTQEGQWAEVLVIGGGDGGSAREILRHPHVKTVTLCEIDPAVIHAATEYLPTIWAHPYLADRPLHEDSRLKVKNVDAIKFLQEAYDAGKRFDFIVVDASDPIGPGIELYRSKFYKLLKDSLNEGGAVAIQGGSFVYLKLVFSAVYHGLKAHFPIVKPINCVTQLYPGGVWNLAIATLGDDPADVDEDIVAAIQTPPGFNLKWYTSEVHKASFALPPAAYTVLAKPPPSLEELERDAADWSIFGEPKKGGKRS